MRKFITVLTMIITMCIAFQSCATLPKQSNTNRNIWSECESPECHSFYRDTNEPHYCDKCSNHKCFKCYYLTDETSENGDKVFIKRDMHTDEITIYFEDIDTFYFDEIIKESVSILEPKDGTPATLTHFWYLKNRDIVFMLDFADRTFNMYR